MNALPLLYCLPYAGGDINIYRRWQIALKDLFDVRPVQLPMRGRLINQPALSDMDAAMAYLDAQCPRPVGREVALFGHSMGALLAFELSRHWQKVSGRGPDLLMVSALSAPHRPSARQPLHGLNDGDFLKAVTEMGGIGHEVLQDEELMSLVLPVLKADFALCERHKNVDTQALDVPMLAFAGVEDIHHPPAQVAAWGRCTTNFFEQAHIPGGHFFINTHADFLFQAMRHGLSRLSECLSKQV